MVQAIKNDIKIALDENVFLQTPLKAFDLISIFAQEVSLEKMASITSEIFSVFAKENVILGGSGLDQVSLNSNYTYIESDSVTIGPNVTVGKNSEGSFNCHSVTFLVYEKNVYSPGQETLLNWINLDTTVKQHLLTGTLQ